VRERGTGRGWKKGLQSLTALASLPSPLLQGELTGGGGVIKGLFRGATCIFSDSSVQGGER